MHRTKQNQKRKTLLLLNSSQPFHPLCFSINFPSAINISPLSFTFTPPLDVATLPLTPLSTLHPCRLSPFLNSYYFFPSRSAHYFCPLPVKFCPLIFSFKLLVPFLLRLFPSSNISLLKCTQMFSFPLYIFKFSPLFLSIKLLPSLPFHSHVFKLSSFLVSFILIPFLSLAYLFHSSSFSYLLPTTTFLQASSITEEFLSTLHSFKLCHAVTNCSFSELSFFLSPAIHVPLHFYSFHSFIFLHTLAQFFLFIHIFPHSFHLPFYSVISLCFLRSLSIG